ncbi:MAG: substrate-binding domain-containing protein, partial [Planctomycetota bacterium]|nr:substrate-binding domain-containing protein [Planctomycetota bacterium]
MKNASFLLLACFFLLSGCGENAKPTPNGGDGDQKAKSNAETKGGGDNSAAKTGSSKIKVAYVTNGVAEFWNIAKAGALKAGKDLGCQVEVVMPNSEGGRAANQQAELEKLIANKFQGIAVSPVDPDNQTDILNQVGENAEYITHDSDAPKSNRKLYIGMSNYDAGFMVAELVKQACPDGGNVVLFIGSIDQLNGKLRRQGVIDGLLGRSKDEKRSDPNDKEIKGDKYTILTTYIDGFDEALKTSQPEQALAKYKDIACMVGLFEYNPPKIFGALKSDNQLGKIKVVGFDENIETLQQIREGNCQGTVVQNPYQYGYQSVQVL